MGDGCATAALHADAVVSPFVDSGRDEGASRPTEIRTSTDRPETVCNYSARDFSLMFFIEMFLRDTGQNQTLDSTQYKVLDEGTHTLLSLVKFTF